MKPKLNDIAVEQLNKMPKGVIVWEFKSTCEDFVRLIARNGKKMSTEQKIYDA